MALETVEITTFEGIATLTLNRPKAMNALNPQLIADLRAGLAQQVADESVRVIVVTGAGRGFCAGADLAAGPMRGPGEGSVGDGIAQAMETGFNPLIEELARCPKPTIAAVNGTVAGGGVGVALACDLVVAARSASFIQVFGPRLGIVPDMGTTWFLPRLIGPARARALAILGDALPAETAAAWGLIWQCVEDTSLAETVSALARRLAVAPPLVFADIKRTLDASWHNDLPAQLDLEKETQRRLCSTQDFLEGVTAFIEKREPRFTGR